MLFMGYVIQNGKNGGTHLLFLKSKTLKAAKEELQQLVIGTWDPQGSVNGWSGGFWEEGKEIEQVLLIKVSRKEEMPIEKWYDSARKQSHKLYKAAKKKERVAKLQQQRAEIAKRNRN